MAPHAEDSANLLKDIQLFHSPTVKWFLPNKSRSWRVLHLIWAMRTTPLPPTTNCYKLSDPNNVVEQDHRGVKRVTRPMLGFKSLQWHKTRWSGSS